MSTSPENKEPTSVLKFVTEKDQSFRTYHADGAWGMVNHLGNIQLNFFVEHVPMARSATYQLDAEGMPIDDGVLDIPEEKGKNLIIREYQSAVVMSLHSARTVHATLGNFIKNAEEMALRANANVKQD